MLDAVNLACEANAVEMSRAFGSGSVDNARRPMKVLGGKAAVKQRVGEIEELASTARDKSQKSKKEVGEQGHERRQNRALRPPRSR